MEVTIYCSDEIIIKEIRKGDNIILTNKYSQLNDSLFIYNHKENTTSISKLDPIDFIEEQWTVEGFKIKTTELLQMNFSYLDYNSILVNRIYSFPNSNEDFNTKLIFSEIPEIEKYILDSRYLNLLNLKNNSNQFFPYIYFVEGKTINKSGKEFLFHKLKQIDEMEVPSNFFIKNFDYWN